MCEANHRGPLEAEMKRPLITVLVPTYRRPRALERCLCALANQSRAADQVVVVHRREDDQSRNVVGRWADRLPLTIVHVNEPGVVAAMNAGLAASTCDVIALTDDDAAPHPDWLTRIEEWFAESQIGGVGGRDVLFHDGQAVSPNKPIVGKVRWFGRVIGNHHLGVGAARDVDVLKGVNCAYRADVLRAVGFDTRLRGSGAQVHWELALGLQLRRTGWRLVYDPSILVDHYEESRADVARVGVPSTVGRAVEDASYNEALVLLEHLPPFRGVAYEVWSILMGTRASPGIGQALRLTPSLGGTAWRRWRAATSGRYQAWRSTGTQAQAPKLPDSGRRDRVAVAGLTAIVIAQNEAERIDRCLRSCFRVADEVVVVDGGSSDATPDIARRLGCMVVENPWPGYAAQRQVGVAHATKDWVLFVDADEEVTAELAESILSELTGEPRWDAYAVMRIGDFLGRWMAPDQQVRLCRRTLASYRDVLVHETLDIAPVHTGLLTGVLLHRGFRSVSDHVMRFDRYTTLEAQQAWAEGRRPSVLRLLARPPARLAEKFAYRGLWRKGISGVAVSGLWAYYEFLRELKLFELAGRKGERRD